MGFNIDFAPLGQGLTAIAGAVHGNKVEDYNKKQQELVQIINEINSATTPEAKQAAQSKLDAFASTVGTDPQLQQMYQQATAGVDKFQSAYDMLKKDQPGAFNTQGTVGSDGRVRSGYSYDPNDSSFKFTGMSGLSDKYNPLTGERVYDAQEGGEFNSLQDYLNFLRTSTADQESWSQAQLAEHQAKLANDPEYAQSFGLPPDKVSAFTIDDLIQHQPTRLAYAKTKVEEQAFNMPAAQRLREAENEEKFNWWKKQKVESINLDFQDWQRKRAITERDKARATTKGDRGFGTDINLARTQIAKASARQNELSETLINNPVLAPYLEKQGIKDAGIDTQAQLMFEVSARAKSMYGNEYVNLSPEEQDSVTDAITTELKKTLPKSRIADLSADVTKAGNELVKIPLGDWVMVENDLGEYYALDEKIKDNREVVVSASAYNWAASVSEWAADRKGNPGSRLQDFLNKNNIVVSPDDLTAMNAASNTYLTAADTLAQLEADGKYGTKEWKAQKKAMDMAGNQINEYVLTGGLDVPRVTQDPLTYSKTGSELPLFNKTNVVDPTAAQSMHDTAQQTRKAPASVFTLPQAPQPTDVVDPNMFKGLEKDMSIFVSGLSAKAKSDIINGSSGKFYFDKYVEKMAPWQKDSNNIRQTKYQDIAYEQFINTVRSQYKGD